MFDFNLLDKGIVLAPDELRPFFKDIKNKNIFLDFKFVTKSEIQSELFYDFTDEALVFLLKKNVSYDVATKFLSYLKKGATFKENNHQFYVYEKELSDHNLLYNDEYNKLIYKNKKIYVFAYDLKNPELIHLQNILKDGEFIEVSLNELFAKNDIKTVSLFKTVDEEIRYVFNLICREQESNKKIKLIADESTTEFYISAFKGYYNLKFSDQKKSLFDTKLAKLLLKNIDNFNLKNYLSENEEKLINEEHFEEIKEIITNYDIDNLNDKTYIFQQILKSKKIKSNYFENEIELANHIDFDPNYSYFLITAYEGFVPSVVQNNDLLDDSIKEKMYLETSVFQNKLNSDLMEFFVQFSNLKYISSHSKDVSKARNVSFLLTEKLGFKYINPTILNFEFSEDAGRIFYSKYDELYNNFNEINDQYSLLKSKFGERHKYDNSYKKINRFNNAEIKFSYSYMDTFYKCPFRYFCDQTLKLGGFDSTTYTKFGHIAHHVFEKVYQPDFNFQNEFNKAVRLEDLDYKDLFFLEKFKKDIEYAVKLNNERYKISKQTKYYSEESISYKVDEKSIFKGSIDSVLELDNKYLVIIDYKTGSYFNKAKYFEYGLGLQLPSYAYLLSKSENPNLNSKKIIGLYNFPIANNKIYNPENKDYQNEFLLDGYTYSDREVVANFDPTVKDKSSYIYGVKSSSKSFKISKDKDLNSKILENFINITDEKIKNHIKSVREYEFPIKPVYFKNNDSESGCPYCDYNDICFIKEEDKKIYDIDKLIEKEENN